MFFHTAKSKNKNILLLPAHQRGINTFVFLKLHLYMYLKFYPLFSPSESYLICLLTRLHHYPCPLLIHSVYKSSSISKISAFSSSDTFSLAFDQYPFQEGVPHLTSSPSVWESSCTNFPHLDFDPISILKQLF